VLLPSEQRLLCCRGTAAACSHAVSVSQVLLRGRKVLLLLGPYLELF